MLVRQCHSDPGGIFADKNFKFFSGPGGKTSVIERERGREREGRGYLRDYSGSFYVEGHFFLWQIEEHGYVCAVLIN